MSPWVIDVTATRDNRCCVLEPTAYAVSAGVCPLTTMSRVRLLATAAQASGLRTVALRSDILPRLKP